MCGPNQTLCKEGDANKQFWRNVKIVTFWTSGMEMFDTRQDAFLSLHYSIQCTVYIIQYTVYIIQCTVYSIQYTVYSIQYTVYSIQYTVYIIHYTVYSIQCTVYIVYVYCPLSNIQNTQYTVHNVVCTVSNIYCRPAQAMLASVFPPPAGRCSRWTLRKPAVAPGLL